LRDFENACRGLENRGSIQVIANVTIERAQMTSYWRSIVTNWLYLVPFVRHSMSKNIATLKSRSRVIEIKYHQIYSILVYPVYLVPLDMVSY